PWRPPSLAGIVRELAADRSLVRAAQRRVATRLIRTERAMSEDFVRLVRELPVGAPVAEHGTAEHQFLAEFARGTARAAALSPSRLSWLVDRLRKTDTYRDLRLRRLLSERARLSVEESLLRLFSWTKSR